MVPLEEDLNPVPVNPMDLTGSVILVTGASSGIGREIAILLSHLNARVILAGRNPARLADTMAALAGSGHRMETIDLALGEAIPQWLKSVAVQTGPLQGIVHAAGRQLTVPIKFLTEANLDNVLRTNVHSALMLARGFAHKACHQPGGSLVFLSSIAAFAGRPALSAYSASKGALVSLAKSLAIEFAPQRIRVNCIAPAFVETEMLTELRATLSEAQWKALEDAHPLGLGTPRDIAHAAAFLLGPASRWITGSTLVVDGGYSAQ